MKTRIRTVSSLLRILLPTLVLATPLARAGAETLLLQVEDFQGSWRRQVNIPGYLAKGFCTSNANPSIAETPMRRSVEITEGGHYFVWVRAYASPGELRGLQVAVDGKRLAATHVESERQWSWQAAGSLDLKAGRVEVAVFDADIGYETADAVLLTDDRAFDPTDHDAKWVAEDRNWQVYPDGLPSGADALRFNIEACNALSAKRTDPATKEEWEARRPGIELELRKAMGLEPWPEKTPLEARITGSADRTTYTIENVVFESRPRFYVTANLYIPKDAPRPMPALVVASGHAMEKAKNYDLYRTAELGFVRRGFAVLAYDPIGQGERLAPGNVHAMNYAAFMTGATIEGYMVWDTMRAVDYLLTRPEVDPRRIGLTGNSGGGLNTLHTAPIDPRIAAAASFCCTCEYYAWIKDGGRHCPCNCQIGTIPLMEEFEVVALAAPRPFLAGNGSLDPIFPIAGVRRTMARARRIYDFYGAPEAAALVESPEPHGWSARLREPADGWFGYWLQDEPTTAPIREAPITLEDVESPALYCLKDGKMPEDAETFATLIRQRAERLVQAYAPVPEDAEAHRAWADGLRKRLWEAFGGEPAASKSRLEPIGTFAWEDGRVERLTLRSEPGMEVSALLLRPRPAPEPMAVLICLDAAGKTAARYSELARGLLASGCAVLALDVRGVGEAGVAADWVSNNAAMLGRPMAAQQAWDAIAAARALALRSDVDGARIGIYGSGPLGTIATLAGALSNDFATVASAGALVSYVSAIEAPPQQPSWLFPAKVLTVADLPRLSGAQAPRPVLALNPVGSGNATLSAEEADAILAPARIAYRAAGAPEAFTLAVSETPDRLALEFFQTTLLKRNGRE